MKTIPVTKGKNALVDDADYALLSSYRWQLLLHGGYAKRKSYGKSILMHRQIMNPPVGLEVDHINGDGLDNRRSNLRVCTREENARNQRCRKNNKLGLKGVTPTKEGTFRAMIMVSGNQISLGTYKTAQEASQSYRQAAIKYHGEFANVGPQIVASSYGINLKGQIAP